MSGIAGPLWSPLGVCMYVAQALEMALPICGPNCRHVIWQVESLLMK